MLRDTYPAIADALAEGGWDYAELWDTAGREGVLALVACAHKSDAGLDSFGRVSRNCRFPHGIGLPGRVAQFGQPEWLDHLGSLPPTVFLRTGTAREIGLHVALGCPIMAGREPVGVLACFARNPRWSRQRLNARAADLARRLGAQSRADAAQRNAAEPRAGRAPRDCGWPRHVRMIEAGHALFHEGDTCHFVYRVDQGLIALQRIDADGDTVLVRLARPGDLLGWRGGVAGEPHSVTAVALSSTLVTAIRIGEFLELSRIGGSTEWILAAAAAEVATMRDMLTRMVTLPARRRLALFLVEFGRNGEVAMPEGEIIIPLPLARQQIAAVIGVKPETLSRIAAQLEDDGIARFNGRLVTIPSWDALIATAGLADGAAKA